MSQNWDELGLRENNNRTLSLLSLFWPMARTLLLCPGQPSCCSLAKWANICNVLHHYHIPWRYWRSTAHQHVTWSWSKSNHHSERSPALGSQTSDPGPLWGGLAALENGWCLQCQVYPWSIPGKASSLAGKSWRFCACFYHVSHVCRQVGWDEINLL